MTQDFVRPGTRRLALVAATATLSMALGATLAQTTRTAPSASSTVKSIPSSSSTSPNSPCNSTNPTSPCYSANAPRDPCYSALTPNEPCSTTTTPSPQNLRPTSAEASPTRHALTGGPFTTDQAMARIGTAGYTDVSRLRKDANGVWRGSAVKDGITVNVTLDPNGEVTAN